MTPRRHVRAGRGPRGVRLVPPPRAAAPGAAARAAGSAAKSADVDPTGHAVRMDALHLIRAAAEFADALERDAQNASAAQIQRTEIEVTPPPA